MKSTTNGRPFIASNISVPSASIWEATWVASTTKSTILASSNFWRLRAIPICSTTSSVERSPAVSINRKSVPPSVKVSSMTSRVVPCTSLTMARSSWSNALRSVDFPEFVLPTIATGRPFFNTFPVAKESARRCVTLSICAAMASSAERSANSKSSWSEKSNSSSSNEVRCTNCSRNTPSCLLKSPRIWLIATWWLAAVVEAMTSATASACDKSILPLRKARCVNSPGAAASQPAARSNCTTRCRM